MHSLILRNEWGITLSVTGPKAPMNQRFWVLYFSLGFVWRTTEKRFSTNSFQQQMVLQPIRQFYFHVFFLFWFSIFIFVFFEEQERNRFICFLNKGFYKGGPSAPNNKRFRIRYLIPEGAQLTKCFCNPLTKCFCNPLTKCFCNPLTKCFSDFHFMLVHSFSLSLSLNTWRETVLCWKQRF